MMTPDELLDRMRYYTDNKAAVVVYEHGTCVAGHLREGVTRPFVEIAETIVKRFDVEKEGAGSPLGDFNLLNMDDGNTVITFTETWYFCCTVRSGVEMLKEPIVERYKTSESFLTERRGSDVLLDALHGLSAREARTKDARERKVVRLYDPRDI